MKNKVIRQIVGGMFALTMTVVPATSVLATPVAGVFSELNGDSETAAKEAGEKASSKKNTKKNGNLTLTSVSKENKKTEKTSESIEEIGTELGTESVSLNTSKLENTATAGISLVMADIYAEETEKVEAEAAAENAVASEKKKDKKKKKADTEATDTEATDTEATDTETTEAAEAGTEASTETAGTEAGTEASAETASTEAAETENAEGTASTEAAEDAEVAAEEPHEDAFLTDEVVSEFADKGIAVVEDFVNVRTEPSAESEPAGKLYKNNACDVLGVCEDGQWLRIKSGDLEGFVSADYISVGDPEVIKQAIKRVAKVNTETLYVRELPTQDSEIIGMVPDQELLTVADETYLYNWGWVGVNVEEGVGYVSAEFVDLSTEYSYGETKEAEEARIRKEEEERKRAEEELRRSQMANAASESGKSSGSGSSASGGVSAPGGSGGASVANYALQFVGNPYVYGGSSLTNGTDCSGFVMSVYAAFGVGLPHSSSALRGCGYGVDVGSMSAGDIVCYSGHVGICIGNGQIVHASNAATGIKVSTAYYRDILAVRRIF